MGASSETKSPGRGALLSRFLGVLSLLVLAFPGGGRWVGTVEATTDYPFVDSDHDGLSDRIEAHLSEMTTDPALAANPFNADSDGDGMPDGFEYCLSHLQQVVSPGSTPPMVPTITLGSHQEGDHLVLTLYVVPGDPSELGRFRFLAAAPNTTGGAVVIEATDLLVDNIVLRGSQTLVQHGPYSMGVYEARTSIALLDMFASVAFAVVAEVAGERVGDSATFTVHEGTAYRWEYSSSGNAPGAEVASEDGSAEAQDDAGEEAEPEKVCISTEVFEPTGVPGLLVTAPLSTSCQSGTRTCTAGNFCSDGGAAHAEKLVLDVDWLLQ